MDEYIDAGKKLIPKNLTAGFNTIMGAVNILQLMKNKLYPEYLEIKQAKNFQIDDPTTFSSIYQSDIDLEKKKRESKIIKNEHFKKVKEFIKAYKFDKIFHSRKIGEHFYDRATQVCAIDLEVLIKDQTGFFTQNLGWTSVQKCLNQAVEETSFILLEYFKAIYKQKNLLDEFLVSFSEIQDFIYTQIIIRVKDKQTAYYKSLTKNLKQFLKDEKAKKFDLDKLFLGLQEQGIILDKWNDHLESSYKYLKQNFQNSTTIDNEYKISRVFIYKYLKKMRRYYLAFSLEKLQSYRILENQEQKEDMKEFLSLQFLQFFYSQKLVDGICDPVINQNLQYLIYSIDWIQSSGEADFALKLLDDISQYHFNVSQSQSQIFYNQRFSVNILIEYKQNNKGRCQQAQEWWKNNINENQNLLIIFQLYILTLGIGFKDGKFKLPNYQPQKRNMLIQVLRYLNNGKYNYINFNVLKFCELFTNQIQIQILEQIEKKLIEQKKSESQNHYLDIFVYGQEFSLQIDTNNQQNTVLLNYYQRHYLLKQIVWQTSSHVNSLKSTQGAYLQQLMAEVKRENQQTLKVDPPKNFYFQVLSKPQFSSNVVTLCISGFLSLNNDKEEKWQNIIQEESGTVISLYWDCAETIDLAKAVASQIPQFAIGTLFALATGAINLLTSNPYENAHNEAVKVGQYLAYLIAEKRIFGDCQINIACHSLGSQIVLECVKVLDKLYTKYRQQYIQEIMFMGGVADTRKLQKRRWNAVSGNIYNIYSSKDSVLTFILKLAKIFDKPCGLQPIQIGYKQVINCDFTHIINGHNDYFPKLQQVLLLSDFNNDLKAIISNIKEEFDI